jgi:hypothetical protein
MTARQKSAVFYGILNKEGVLTVFNKFLHIKFRKVLLNPEPKSKYVYYDANGKKRTRLLYTDHSGGSFERSEINKIAKELNIDRQTLLKDIDNMIELGWITSGYKSYRHISLTKIFRMYAPDLNIKKITFRDFKKVDVLNMSAFFYLKANLLQQLYKQRGCPQRLPKYSKALLKDEQFSMSVRALQKVLGYSSPMSSCQRLLDLEKKGWINIKRRSEFLCKKDELKYLIKGNPELSNKLFCDSDNVYVRLCNNIYFYEDKKRA